MRRSVFNSCYRVLGIDPGWKTLCKAEGLLFEKDRELRVSFTTEDLRNYHPQPNAVQAVPIKQLQSDPIMVGSLLKKVLNTNHWYTGVYIENQHASPQKELLWSLAATCANNPHIGQACIIHPATVKKCIFRPWLQKDEEKPPKHKEHLHYQPPSYLKNKSVARTWLQELIDTYLISTGRDPKEWTRGVEITDHMADALGVLLVGLATQPPIFGLSLNNYTLVIDLPRPPHLHQNTCNTFAAAKWPINIHLRTSTIRVGLNSQMPHTIQPDPMDMEEEEQVEDMEVEETIHEILD